MPWVVVIIGVVCSNPNKYKICLEFPVLNSSEVSHVLDVADRLALFVRNRHGLDTSAGFIE